MVPMLYIYMDIKNKDDVYAFSIDQIVIQLIFQLEFSSQ